MPQGKTFLEISTNCTRPSQISQQFDNEDMRFREKYKIYTKKI